ncbi:tetratricopeptide repeat protein [Streptomyces sp. DSM 40484]|uniref:tetratricopeptide repeat protein n=2 Tax=Streptomyces TaxID=1883 RepID=UPI0028D3FDFC|nr:tetratricopeptide repeat protein [Streptomyces sp. DSM 40484]
MDSGVESGTDGAVAGGTEVSGAGGVRTESAGRRAVLVRRVLVGAVLGCFVLGGVLVVLPDGGRRPPPSPGPMARAVTAVGSGAPASLPDLVALIGDREAHLRAHPGDVRSWAELGTAYVERGRRTAEPGFYPKADAALRTSLKGRPKGNTEAFRGMAVLANTRRDFRAAREWGEAAVASSPKRWSVYPALIDAYRGLGDYKGARRALAKLVELPSGGGASGNGASGSRASGSGPAAQVLVRAGLVYRDRGWREDSAAALSDAAALAATPAERADCLVRVGESAWERGEAAESLRAFEAALRADPGEHAARAGQGRALAALGRDSEALLAYQSALAKQPLPRYALELGELYESLGLGGAARAQYDVLRARVREGDAVGVDEELVLGLFEADHGDAGDAVRRLRGEWARHPSAAVADALGWALHRDGKDKEAVGFATRATDRVRGGGARVALYSFHRGVIERGVGNGSGARRHLGEALRISPVFSPLLVPVALRALEELGEPPAVRAPGRAPVPGGGGGDEGGGEGGSARR